MDQAAVFAMFRAAEEANERAAQKLHSLLVRQRCVAAVALFDSGARAFQALDRASTFPWLAAVSLEPRIELELDTAFPRRSTLSLDAPGGTQLDASEAPWRIVVPAGWPQVRAMQALVKALRRSLLDQGGVVLFVAGQPRPAADTEPGYYLWRTVETLANSMDVVVVVVSPLPLTDCGFRDHPDNLVVVDSSSLNWIMHEIEVAVLGRPAAGTIALSSRDSVSASTVARALTTLSLWQDVVAVDDVAAAIAAFWRGGPLSWALLKHYSGGTAIVVRECMRDVVTALRRACSDLVRRGVDGGRPWHAVIEHAPGTGGTTTALWAAHQLGGDHVVASMKPIGFPATDAHVAAVVASVRTLCVAAPTTPVVLVIDEGRHWLQTHTAALKAELRQARLAVVVLEVTPLSDDTDGDICWSLSHACSEQERVAFGALWESAKQLRDSDGHTLWAWGLAAFETDFTRTASHVETLLGRATEAERDAVLCATLVRRFARRGLDAGAAAALGVSLPLSLPLALLLAERGGEVLAPSTNAAVLDVICGAVPLPGITSGSLAARYVRAARILAVVAAAAGTSWAPMFELLLRSNGELTRMARAADDNVILRDLRGVFDSLAHPSLLVRAFHSLLLARHVKRLAHGPETPRMVCDAALALSAEIEATNDHLFAIQGDVHRHSLATTDAGWSEREAASLFSAAVSAYRRMGALNPFQHFGLCRTYWAAFVRLDDEKHLRSALASLCDLFRSATDGASNYWPKAMAMVTADARRLMTPARVLALDLKRVASPWHALVAVCVRDDVAADVLDAVIAILAARFASQVAAFDFEGGALARARLLRNKRRRELSVSADEARFWHGFSRDRTATAWVLAVATARAMAGDVAFDDVPLVFAAAKRPPAPGVDADSFSFGFRAEAFDSGTAVLGRLASIVPVDRDSAPHRWEARYQGAVVYERGVPRVRINESRLVVDIKPCDLAEDSVVAFVIRVDARADPPRFACALCPVLCQPSRLNPSRSCYAT